ncbi:H(+)/Cl(-) exchange transporter 7 [Pseudolycoriella hygida]|uniref:Chloride channel protein n=1 Tax=Pseudolycoriella hygida TaxID=35572 RepID=A0A9Q0N112_9DIPT|nr:H(+)/Cl(-) exchange transporter 7 [Pseudolycoriella hygida]
MATSRSYVDALLRNDEDNISDDEILITCNNEPLSINTNPTDIEQRPLFIHQRPPETESIYESLDYDICENVLYKSEQKNRHKSFTTKKDLARWLVFILIGVCTGITACFIDVIIEVTSTYKYNYLKDSVDYNVIKGDLYAPYLFYVLTNIVPVALGSILVTYIEPIAAGSGIPLVKCYLNGVKVPRIVRFKTFVIKVVGVITSVLGGLAGGKEGPMIHAGSVIAAGISQGKSTTFRKDLGIFRYFRDDHEKRDFVVGGASAGVAAAFGAPLGGVLFAIEEAASYWNPTLIWKALIASIISSFTLNVILSWYHNLKTFSYPGLFNLGQFEPLPYEYFELPIFVAMGMFGGLAGAIWNSVNIKLTIFRSRYVTTKFGRVLEAMCIAAITATLACCMMFTMNDCRPLGLDPTPYPVQLFCEDNEYNAIAALWFQTPEQTVKSLFHDPPGSHRIISLLVFVIIYYVLSCVTYGLSVSLGIFIPSLLVGAAWGRLTAMNLASWFPNLTFIHPGKYALIGAAANLGGIVRMTLSLSVILIESTGNISFALPLIITLISAKWMGDYFNNGIYDTNIEVAKVPMLPWYSKKSAEELQVRQIMNNPPVCIRMKESVSTIVHILKKYTYNGFPVVDEVSEGDDPSSGRLRGFILRSQLIVILKNRFYEELQESWIDDVSIDDFRDEYPRYPSIDKINIIDDRSDYTINSEMFMNPSPHTVPEISSVNRSFQMFRCLALRHLIVVDANNCVSGLITRKDFVHNTPN